MTEQIAPVGLAPDPLHEFVEQIGLFVEDAGLPRMSGRIIGWLLVCEPEHQSAEQLAAALGASRGSISTMTQLLLRAGLIERITVAGSRRTYYRHGHNAWTQQMRSAMSQVTRARVLAKRGLRALGDAPEARRRRLDEMLRFHEFFEAELPALMERWEKARAES